MISRRRTPPGPIRTARAAGTYPNCTLWANWAARLLFRQSDERKVV